MRMKKIITFLWFWSRRRAGDCAAVRGQREQVMRELTEAELERVAGGRRH